MYDIQQDTVFVDLRYYGDGWYHNLELPDEDFTSYVVSIQFTRWISPNRTLAARCDLFRETVEVDHVFVKLWGSNRDLKPGMILVDKAFVKLYPQVLPSDFATRV